MNINISKCITTKKKDNISTNSATAPTDVKLNWSHWALKNTPHCENFNLPRMLHAGWDLSTAHVVRCTFVSPTEQNNRPCIRCHRAVKCSKLHLDWEVVQFWSSFGKKKENTIHKYFFVTADLPPSAVDTATCPNYCLWLHYSVYVAQR